MAEPYWLDALLISGFRAYLEPKTFDFSNKRCLGVFAPNGSGKSSIVDALEFMFSADGTLERLGLRTIYNQAGIAALTHNLAAEKNINSLVGVAFRRGAARVEGTRQATGSQRVRPRVADVVAAHLVVDPIVRGHALRSFVEHHTAEKRYEDVARWLQLGALVDVQQNLRALRHETKTAAESNAEVKRLNGQLAKRTANGLDAWDADAVLAYSNALIDPLDKKLDLKNLAASDPALAILKERAEREEKELGLEGLRQIRRAACSLHEMKALPNAEYEACGAIREFEKSIGDRDAASATEAAERKAAATAVFDKLWSAAEPLFADDKEAPATCPICDTPLEKGASGSAKGVREHIAKHRAELAAYAKAKRAFDAAQAKSRRTHTQLLAGLKALQPLLGEPYSKQKPILDAYLVDVERWDENGTPVSAPLQEALIELVQAVGASIASIEAKQGEQTYAKVFHRLNELVDLKEEWDLNARTQSALRDLSSELNEQVAFVDGEIRKKVQSLLDKIQGPLNDIYGEIQGADAAPIRMELPAEDDTNQQRLNLVIDFAANRVGVQPSGYLSDSQIHSIALAFRLAAIRYCNPDVPLIALDDVVTSYDANHRRTIAAVLAKMFGDSQIILTTHDERFFIYLKEQLGDKNWQFSRITRLDRDFGPRFVDHKITDDMIEARWHDGNSAANEIRQAEEEWLLGLSRDLGVDVRIRSVEKAHSYERYELAAALERFFRDQGLTPPLVPGVNNRFLLSLQQGAVENFGSHFQDNPNGYGSIGDEKARWAEFTFFRQFFCCTKCGRTRFKRPIGMHKAVCAHDKCETPLEFPVAQK